MDPLAEVTPSNYAPSVVGDEAESQEAEVFERPRARAMQIDHSINLTLTESGIRRLLGRKPDGRPKPLLCITCVACGLTTHSEDVFLAADFLESFGRN